MRKHCNEYMKSGLANSGRIAGSGISYDRYDDESGCESRNVHTRPIKIAEREEKAKKEREGSPVKTYYIECEGEA